VREGVAGENRRIRATVMICREPRDMRPTTARHGWLQALDHHAGSRASMRGVQHAL